MSIKIERVGSRIWLSAPYSPTTVASCKSIVGASWRKSDKVWTYPLDMVICRDLRKKFGQQLLLGPQLVAWAKGQVEQQKALAPLLTAKDAELERVPEHAPLIWEAMNDGDHNYQKPVVRYCTLARRSQNASQPGLGKTIETLATLVEADVRGLVLVAAPKTSLRLVWEAEVRRWLPGTPVYATTGDRNRRIATLATAMSEWMSGNHKMVIVVVNPEMLRTTTIEECNSCEWKLVNHSEKNKESKADPEHDNTHKLLKYYEHEYPILFEQDWATFIVDETHRYILNVNLRTNRATQTGTGAMLLPLADDALKLALSGTPWKGKPRNAWSVGHFLFGDEGLAASFWNWAFRMLKVEDDGYGKVVGEVNDVEAFNAWTDTFMIRHTKAEMAPWLPPKSYAGVRLDPDDKDSPIAIWLDMDGKQAKAYAQMRDDASAALDSGTLTATGVLAEMTRLKQFASGHGNLHDKLVLNPNTGKKEIVQVFKPSLPSNKFDYMIQVFDEHGITGDDDEDGDSKLVIASQFTEYIDLFAGEFTKRGIDCFALTGKTSDKNRQAYVQRFQKPGGPRVFLLNTMAGGVAVTLDAADDLFFLDETYVPDDQEQVEDRTHRTSRIHNVTIHYLKTRGTIDETIARQNAHNDNIQKMLLDGKRGVEFARRLLIGE